MKRIALAVRQILAAAAVCMTFSTAASATVVIDDFSTGGFAGAFLAAPGDTNAFRVQTGSMAGGERAWNLLLRGASDLGAVVDISPAAGGFKFDSNIGVGHRFDWNYGTTYVRYTPMMLDLSGESTLRFSFQSVSRGLNFNVLMYFRGQADNYSQLGVNLAPSTTPTNLDFSFANFASVIADPARPADFSKVSGIYIVTQSGGYAYGGGESFLLKSISAVPEPEQHALLLAGLGLLSMVARRRMRGR